MDIFLKEINRRIIYFTFCFFLSCDSSQTKSLEVASSSIGLSNYKKISKLVNDTLFHWQLNKIGGTLDSTISINYFDSLICFNSKKDRFIGSILISYVNKKEPSVADGIFYFFGEKINEQWYFFTGPYIHIPREMVKNHNINKPLSYSQLHQIALKEIYSGYLNRNGEINEDWFLSHFEGPGWGDFNNQASIDWVLNGKRFDNKKEFFEFLHLEVVKNNWNGVNKDSIKPLPPNPLP